MHSPSPAVPARARGAPSAQSASRTFGDAAPPHVPHLHAIYAHAREYVGLLDTAGVVLDANPAALKLVGSTLEAVRDLPFGETPWWSHSPALQQRLHQAIERARSGESDRFDATHCSATGEIIDVDFSMTPIVDDAGQVVALLPEGRDVSIAKSAERALRAAEARLEFIVANSPQTIFVQDSDLTITWIRNPPAQLGVTSYVGATDEEFGRAVGAEPAFAHWLTRLKRELLATGERCSFSCEVPAHTRSRWFECVLEPMPETNGRVPGLLGYARDCTDARDALLAVNAARRQAEAASRSKSRLLSIVSHDLRQPLQTLRLLTVALEGRVQDPELLELVHREQRALTSAGELVESLLDFGRLESGALEVSLDWVDLTALLDRLREELLPRAQQQGVELKMAPIACAVRSDRVWLRRILQNLLTNAIRYTPAGGQVSLVVTLDAGAVEIEVTDTGRGISGDQLERIFEPFYQAGEPTDSRPGWGLGLSIVKLAAALLGHRIGVKSEPGRGTVFTVRLESPARLDTRQSVTRQMS